LAQDWIQGVLSGNIALPEESSAEVDFHGSLDAETCSEGRSKGGNQGSKDQP